MHQFDCRFHLSEIIIPPNFLNIVRQELSLNQIHPLSPPVAALN